MTNLVAKYKEGDILSVLVRVEDVEEDNGNDFAVYTTQLLNTDLTVDSYFEEDIYVDNKQVVKKLSQSDIDKFSTRQLQQQLKELKAEVAERQAKINSIENKISTANKKAPANGRK